MTTLCRSFLVSTNRTTLLAAVFNETVGRVTRLKTLITAVKSISETTTFFCWESRDLAEHRHCERNDTSDPEYRLPREHAIALTLMMTSPATPCLFMGSEFFTAVPFDDSLQRLHFDFISDTESRDYRHYSLTRDLIDVRKRYLEGTVKWEETWSNEAAGVMRITIQSNVYCLVLVVNLSGQNYNGG